MSTTDELLEEMLEDAEEYATPVTDDDLQFWIDEHLRVISIPKNGVVAGVEGDKNVNKIKFGMNRYYHGFDMSTFSGRILYSNAKGNKNYYNITDMQASGSTITFSWLVDADAVQYMGKTAFVVYLFKIQGSELRQKFYSTLAALKVLEGMEVDSAVPVEKQTDIIERMKEEISAYAEEVKKSLPADYTAMTEQVSSLKHYIEQLKQGGTGAENVESRLKGHTMGVIGDSLSDRSRGVTQWFDWIASRAGGMNLSLDCVSGRRLMQFPSDGLSNQCDIICVFGGTNDFNSAHKLGTLDTANTDGKTTFYGAVYTLATELMTNYPKSVIIFITPLSSAPAYNSAENYKWYEYPSMGGHTMKDFCDAIKEVCCYLHIPVVDLFENSGLNYNYDTDNIYFVSDKLHLTDAGQEAISYVIEKKILEHYIPDNANATEIVTLSSISAEFTQGDSLYYPSSSLSDLREHLVVSAHYSDGTSNLITGYSLSGTLTEGTSTITVSYREKTTTFEVTVLAEGASKPFIATLTPDTTLGVGFYYENDFETLATGSPTGTSITCIYSEPVSIAGYNKIERDPDNVTYNWMKIAKVEENGTIIGGCLIVYYDKDMNVISGEVNYDQYTTPSSNVYIAAGLALKNNGTIPDGAVYFRALLPNSSINTNTLKIS